MGFVHEVQYEIDTPLGLERDLGHDPECHVSATDN